MSEEPEAPGVDNDCVWGTIFFARDFLVRCSDDGGPASGVAYEEGSRVRGFRAGEGTFVGYGSRADAYVVFESSKCEGSAEGAFDSVAVASNGSEGNVLEAVERKPAGDPS